MASKTTLRKIFCTLLSKQQPNSNNNDPERYTNHVSATDHICPNAERCSDLGCVFTIPPSCPCECELPPKYGHQSGENISPCENVDQTDIEGHSYSTKGHDCLWTNNNNTDGLLAPFSAYQNTENIGRVDGQKLGYQNPSYRHEDEERTDLRERKVSLDQLQKNIEDSQKLKLSYRTRKFYRRQSELLQSYQEIDSGRDDKIERYNLLQKKVDLYAKLSFGANVLLLLCKSTAAVLSGSMSIITSLVDSVVDLASGVVVWWTNNKVRRTDPRKYPRGRRRMESLAVIILSVIMGVASLYMIKEAAVKVVALAEETRGPPTVDFVTIGISIFTIVIKLVLYLLCRRVRSPTVQALAQDHRNDVFSNTLAIACGYIGSQQVLDRFRYRPLIYVDPVGAILISLYIAITWYKTGFEQSNNIVGKTACHQTISKVTWLCINFDHRIISVANVFAYNSGFYHIVEVELSLPAEMNVMEFIDLSTALKQKLECVEGIETAYVTASPTSELPNRI